MKRISPGPIMVAAVLGAFYSWIAVQFWASYSLDNPFGGWLRIVLSPHEHPSLHLIAISLHDVLVNILVATPFAAIFLLFQRLRKWTCVAVAAIAALVVSYSGTEWGSLPILATHAGFWMGLCMTALSLPMAFLAVRAARSHWPTESSQ